MFLVMDINRNDRDEVLTNSLCGSIGFELVSDKDRQIFKSTWTVGWLDRFSSLNEARLELLSVLMTIKLPELYRMLKKQVKDGSIYTEKGLKELGQDWRVV